MCFDKYCIPEEMFSYFHSDIVLTSKLTLFQAVSLCVCTCVSSWGSGADLWGSDSDSRFGRPRIDDGMLEVVGVTGVVHMVSPDKLYLSVYLLSCIFLSLFTELCQRDNWTFASYFCSELSMNNDNEWKVFLQKKCDIAKHSHLSFLKQTLANWIVFFKVFSWF